MPNSEDTQPHSWLAHISAGLGILCVLAVLCFHFPEWLTSVEFRAAYSEQFARHLLLAGIVGAFVLGTFAILRGRNRAIATLGIAAAAVSLALGGIAVPLDPIQATPYGLGLDWFVVSLLFSALVFIPIEQMMPVRALSPLRPQWRTDLGYYFLGHVLVQFILIAVTTSTTLIDALVANPAIKSTIQNLPFWLQLPVAVFAADLFQALLHRGYHRIPALWRVHAVHHSSKSMDWLAGSRMHLVEIMLTRSFVLLPLIVLGFSPSVLNSYVILVGVQAVVAHANLRLNFGWLEYVLVTPRYHHWHHARHADYMDVNYAIHLPVVDMLMGTFRRPPANTWPSEYGVMKPETVPEGLWAQTISPFRWR